MATMTEQTPSGERPTADQAWRMFRLRNGRTLDEAIRELAAWNVAHKDPTVDEQNLLCIAEGLLELVRLGAVVYMDSEAIEADLYGTVEADPAAHGAAKPLAERKSPRPRDALRAADRVVMQDVFDRYSITDVRVFGPAANGTDEPGSELNLLFRGPESFSGFKMVDLADDLEAVLGVPVNLVSSHPVNRGWLMDHYRATALPLDDLLQRLQRASEDADPSREPQPSPPEDDALVDTDVQVIESLDLPAEFTAAQRWWSEWDPERGTVRRFNLDPRSGNIDALLTALRKHHADGQIIEIWTYSQVRP